MILVGGRAFAQSVATVAIPQLDKNDRANGFARGRTIRRDGPGMTKLKIKPSERQIHPRTVPFFRREVETVSFRRLS